MSLRGNNKTEAISKHVKNGDCHVLWARALKDDGVILRKCPWGAMTGEIN